MSIHHMELFYDGYDHQWIIGRDKGPPIENKPKPPAPPPPKKEPQPVELKVPFCCEGCEEKIYGVLIELDGVDSVKLDPNSDKVTITGKVKPEDCLKEAKKVVKRTEMWPKKKEDEKKDAKKDDKKKPDPPKKEEKKEEKKEAPAPKKDAPKKDGPPPPTELKVSICCEGCAADLYDALKDVDEVTDVNLNASAGKIAVHGKAKPETILKAARKLKPAAELIAAKKK